MLTNDEIARALEPYLCIGDQNLSGAESSVRVNLGPWATHLDSFPMPVDIVARPDGTIARSDLIELAKVARHEESDESIMTLFWTVLAWGLAGTWRNVGRLVAAVGDDIPGVLSRLRTASAASYAGDPETAFITLYRRIGRWGPAFFTKFLHFTSDVADHEKVQPLILDSRVREAWRAFAGTWLDTTSAKDYATYCRSVHDVARARGSEPGWVEGRLYQFGRAIGTYEKLIDARFELSATKLGPDNTPSITEAWQRVSASTDAWAAAAVAERVGGNASDYEASRAPSGSLHDEVWYVHEIDVANMIIDDCVWMVLPNGSVTRAIPVGNPIHPPTDLEELR